MRNIALAVQFLIVSHVFAQTPSPTPQAVGQNFTASWNANAAGDKVVGYKLKYGTTSGNYSTVLNVIAPAVSKEFTNFAIGRFYFVVSAYNLVGESGPSTEVVVDVMALPSVPGGLKLTPSPGLGAVSTRAQVGGADQVLIGGFILQSSKTVAVRALGPSLLGLKALSETSLTLHNSSGTQIRSNNGWQNGPDAAALTANKMAPASPKESALIASLPAGPYTAIVRGPSAGIGLVEVYQLN